MCDGLFVKIPELDPLIVVVVVVVVAGPRAAGDICGTCLDIADGEIKGFL